MNKRSNRIHNTKRNIIFGFLQYVMSQLLPFIVRSIIIYRFGVDYLGLNSLFTSILSVLSLMELGFGTAVVYCMYKPVSEEDTDLICAYLSVYRKTYRRIGLMILFVGLLMMPFLNHFVRDPSIPGDLNLYFCYLIFLSNSVVSYLLYGYMTAIPIAYQRRDVLSRVDMVITLIRCFIQSLVLLMSKNYYLYLVTIPGFTVVSNLCTAYIVKRLYPNLKCKGNLLPNQKTDLRRKVYGLLINKLTIVSRNSIDSFCISMFLGLTATGIYNNYFFVMTAVISFLGIICGSMIPSVGNSIASESIEKNYRDMRLFDFIYMVVAGWGTVCLLCLYQGFIVVWIGKSMILEMPVVIALCAYFYILKFGDIRWVYHEAAGLWWETWPVLLGESIANIVLNVILCKYWGVMGIVLATVLSVFTTNCLLCPAQMFRLYFGKEKLKEYWTDHAYYAFTMLLSAVVSWLLCESIFPDDMNDGILLNGFICLGGRLLVCTVVSFAVFWIIWHRSRKYSDAKQWILKLKKA